jgi:hypothetical protein
MATNTNFQPYLDEVTTTGLICKNDTKILRFYYAATYLLETALVCHIVDIPSLLLPLTIPLVSTLLLQ